MALVVSACSEAITLAYSSEPMTTCPFSGPMTRTTKVSTNRLIFSGVGVSLSPAISVSTWLDCMISLGPAQAPMALNNPTNSTKTSSVAQR